jgi:zinc D-Ala-D-Ala carboxypeptidase
MARLYQSWKDVPKDKWRWANFSPRELACKGSGQLLVDDTALDALQRLRDDLGRPLIVVSAYRSPSHNRKVGGAQFSKHMEGHAFDIRMDNHNPYEFELAAKNAGFRGFGYYPKSGFMHIDMGPPRTWGTPFKQGATNLPTEKMPPTEKPERENVAQSTTVLASATQVMAGAGTGVAAVGALDGTAQLAVMILAGVVILAGMWILRERLRKWADGDR